MKKIILIISVIVLVAIGFYFYEKNEWTNKTANKNMSFFLTSVNPGRGGDLGGLAGADNYCKDLAKKAGVGDKNWVAYLSTGGADIVNAKDRIGTGPWYNFKGELIANNVSDLHSSSTQNNLNKSTALNELGQVVNGRGDTPNEHDILTGSDDFGNYFATTTDSTCNNWTSGEQGSAMVGHHDRIGRDDSAPMKSWVASHLTRGCSLENFKTTGGNGLFYCFAK